MLENKITPNLSRAKTFGLLGLVILGFLMPVLLASTTPILTSIAYLFWASSAGFASYSVYRIISAVELLASGKESPQKLPALLSPLANLNSNSTNNTETKDKATIMVETVVKMSKEPDMETSLNILVAGARTICDAQYAALTVFDQDDKTKVDKMLTLGMTDQQMAGIAHPPVGRGLLGHIHHTQKTLRLKKMTDHAHSSGFPAGHPPMDSLLATPIISNDVSLGNLYMSEKTIGDGSFSAEDERLLIILADLASVSIMEKRMKEKMIKLNEFLAGRTNELAFGIQEFSDSIVEISDGTTKASEAALQNKKITSAGLSVVHSTIQKMDHIVSYVQESSNTIAELGKSSEEINKIVSVIEDIANQTNLLALNAAIEAARAGEQGKGFAVVADEVRKLADRTTSATSEIAGMIQNIQAETDAAIQSIEKGSVEVTEGRQLAQDTGEALEAISDHSQSLSDMLNQIATAAEEQSAAGAEISATVDQIAHTARAGV